MARRYVDAGASVVPITADGSKMPLIKWKEFQLRIASDDEMRRWWRYPSGIGIICGKISGNLEVIDNDAPELWKEYCELIESHDPELYKRLVVIETPSGGKHLPYRCEEIGANQKLAMRAVEVSEQTPGAKKDGNRWIKLEVLFETRGEGGLIVAPGGPLNVHSIGKPYKFIKGSAETIPTIRPEHRDLLLGLARALNEYHPRGQRHERKEYRRAERCAVDGLRAGDDYNERGDIESVLLNHGWTISHRRGAIVFLRKPGKHGKGHQATLHAVAHNVFYCFSTSAGPFEDRKGYSAFQVYGLLEHRRDWSAAAKALAALGYGTRVEQARKNSREAVGQVLTLAEQEKLALDDSSEMTDIINLMTTRWRWSDEDKVTFAAVEGIAGNRKTFRASMQTYASRIRERENSEPEGEKQEAQFGRRRINSLKLALKPIRYPIFRLKTRGGQKGGKINPKTKKPYPSQYQLDLEPFLEARRLSRAYYAEWYAGNPRFSEWQGRPAHPGKARQKAAIEIADKYNPQPNSTDTTIEQQSSDKPDAFTHEQQGLEGLKRAARKVSDSWTDMEKTTAERLIDTKVIFRTIGKVLLQPNARKRTRNAKQLNALINGVFSELGIMPDTQQKAPLRVGINADSSRSQNNSEDSNGYAKKSDPIVDALIEDEAESEELKI